MSDTVVATQLVMKEGSVLPQLSTPCQERLDARPWHRTLAVRTGDYVTGVRANTADTRERLEELLAAVRLPERDAEVSPNISVELADESGHRPGLHLVYRDHEVVARRRRSYELLVDLVEVLDEVPTLWITDRPVVHAAALLTSAGEALLAPAQMHKQLLTRQPQLRAAGIELLRTRTHVVDVASAELVLGRQDAALDTVLRGSVTSDRRVDGTFPIRVWCVPAVGNEPFGLRPIESVFAAFAMVTNRRTMEPGRALRELAEASRRTRFLGFPETTPATIARSLIDLAT